MSEPVRRHAVYFQFDGEYVKIGKTIRPEYHRRKENQTGNPRPLQTLAVIPLASESKLAARFADDRIRGEWYRPSPRLMALIETWKELQDIFTDILIQTPALEQVPLPYE